MKLGGDGVILWEPGASAHCLRHHWWYHSSRYPGSPVQMATRTAPKFGANPSHSLDIVVRNNSHANNPADSLSTITSFDVFVSVVTP